MPGTTGAPVGVNGRLGADFGEGIGELPTLPLVAPNAEFSAAGSDSFRAGEAAPDAVAADVGGGSGGFAEPAGAGGGFGAPEPARFGVADALSAAAVPTATPLLLSLSDGTREREVGVDGPDTSSGRPSSGVTRPDTDKPGGALFAVTAATAAAGSLDTDRLAKGDDADGRWAAALVAATGNGFADTVDATPAPAPVWPADGVDNERPGVVPLTPALSLLPPSLSSPGAGGRGGADDARCLLSSAAGEAVGDARTEVSSFAALDTRCGLDRPGVV